MSQPQDVGRARRELDCLPRRVPRAVRESGREWKNMAKYGRAAQKRVKSAMHRRKKGTLKSSSGRRVTSRKQAIAIGLSEAREKGGKVPSKRSSRAQRSSSERNSRQARSVVEFCKAQLRGLAVVSIRRLFGPRLGAADRAVSRRTAEHRTSRGARGVARRALHPRSTPSGSQYLSPVSRQRASPAPRVSDTRRRRPQWRVHHAGDRVDARQLPSGHRGSARYPSASAAHVLP